MLTRTDGPALNGALAQTGALLGAFSLLVTAGLLIAAVLVAAFAISMARRARKPNQTLKFLDELEDGGNALKPGAPPSGGPSWQKPDDWWSR